MMPSYSKRVAERIEDELDEDWEFAEQIGYNRGFSLTHASYAHTIDEFITYTRYTVPLFDDLFDSIVQRIRKHATYRSLQRVLIDRNVVGPNKYGLQSIRIEFRYRYPRHQIRMMRLLAEPPVPKDILRHIYCFMKK
jgi:hypothetical protein